jgi:hypothetical protein
VGTKTASSTRVVATTGPAHLLHRLDGGLSGLIPVLLDVPRDVLHDDDRVVDHDADREHQPEERERVEREAEQAAMTAKVPMSETGIVTVGMMVARKSCRKMSTVRMTRTPRR